MAFFVAVDAWNTSNLNLHAPYVTPPTTTTTGGGPLVPLGAPVMIDGVSYNLNSSNVSVGGEVDVDWGAGNTTVILGSALTFDGSGNINGGTVQAYGLSIFGSLSYNISGFSITGAQLAKATNSIGVTDDARLFSAMLNNDDLIFLSTLNDTIITGGGIDLVFSGAGADRVTGGGNRDVLLGEAGNDIMAGGFGSDVLFGGADLDKLYGGDANDVLIGGMGKDTLNGGTGKDNFVFEDLGGNDVVNDFLAIDDRIIIRDGATTFADLVIVQATVNNTTVHWGSTTITLQNVQVASLTSADFLFGGDGLIDNAVGVNLSLFNYFI